jgi:hypothetical protein
MTILINFIKINLIVGTQNVIFFLIINEINEVIFTFPHQVLVVKIRIIKRSFKGYI